MIKKMNPRRALLVTGALGIIGGFGIHTYCSIKSNSGRYETVSDYAFYTGLASYIPFLLGIYKTLSREREG